jgi:hypothetical protein
MLFDFSIGKETVAFEGLETLRSIIIICPIAERYIHWLVRCKLPEIILVTLVTESITEMITLQR